MNSIQQMIVNHLNNTVHGSGFDTDWRSLHLDSSKDLTKSGNLLIFGGYHNMNEHGYYDGWTDITLKIPLMNPEDFKIVCKGKRKYNELNKEYFEEVIHESLSQFFGNE